VKTVGTLKKQHGDWHLAIRCCGQPKKRTQGNDGSRKKLATACRRVTHHAGMIWHKGHCHKRPTGEQRWQKSRPETVLYQKPRKDRHSGGGVRQNWNAITAWGNKA
jgi:hypothetical protein